MTAAELQSLKEKVGGTEVSMREEFGRSRKEAADLAQSQREEQRNAQTTFEKRLDDQAKAQQEALRQQFQDLLKQLHTQGKQSL